MLPDERKPDEGLQLKLKYTGYLANAEKLWDSPGACIAGSLEALLREQAYSTSTHPRRHCFP